VIRIHASAGLSEPNISTFRGIRIYKRREKWPFQRDSAAPLAEPLSSDLVSFHLSAFGEALRTRRIAGLTLRAHHLGAPVLKIHYSA